MSRCSGNIGRLLACALALALPIHAEGARDKLLLAVAQGDNALAIFKVDGNTLTPLTSVPIGKGTREVCVSADGRRAYASNRNDSTLTVIDLETQKAIATVALTGLKEPDGCTTSPDSKTVYVALMGSDTVAVVSAETNRMVKQVKVGKEPRRIVFTPDARRILVSSEVSDEILVLDPATNRVIDKLQSGGHGPRMMMFLNDKQTMLSTNVDDDTVSFTKFPAKHAYLTIGAGGSPQRLALSPDGNSAFVLSVLESKISIIDLKNEHIRARKFVPVGQAPWGMTSSDDRKLLFVGSSKENTIVAYDTATMQPVAKVTVKRPMGVEFR